MGWLNSLFPAPPPLPEPAKKDESVENAWKIHAAITDWTGRVDSKANFALTFESALIAAVVTLSQDKKLLSTLNTWWELAWYRLGIALFIVAALSCISVVSPRLRFWHVGNESTDNFIFFGHAKDWQPAKLTVALRERDILPVLSRQIVNMSKGVWKKHRRLQASLFLTTLATFCTAVAATLNN